MIFGAPLLAMGADDHLSSAQFSGRLASIIYSAFSYICHQLPERSFHLAGYKLGVCSRCTGIYSGFAFAVLIYPLARPLNQIEPPSRIWLILGALPLAVDFALGYFQLWQNTHTSRFITAALFSSVTVFFIMPGLVDIGALMLRRFRSHP
jgi:uncharacterized membrane protein